MNSSDEAVEAVRVSLDAIHWDGTGCGTNGTSGCAYCFGPSPATSHEIAAEAVKVAEPIIAAAVRARIERDIIALAPVNCELRADGREDPLFAAWAEGVSDSARVARGRSE